ncbi:MAG: CPBP family intramembrane metalloprotease [Cellvibrio sp.]|nr:CPBP family intramembrane metalloprotease [Cellvibrio sp.]
MLTVKELKPYALLYFLGFIGILSVLPLIPQLLAASPEKPPMSVGAIQAISVLQSSVLLLLMVLLGAVCAKKVGLTTPVILAVVNSTPAVKALKPQILPAILGGIAGGIFILTFYKGMSPYLPAEFIIAGEKMVPPWYTKILYGGITEEILIRWGFMSFFVWAIYRITQQKNTEIKNYNFILAIIVSSLIFAVLHLPVAFSLSQKVAPILIFYILIGNSVFGLIAGYLYWKRGLECAIGSHMIAHITMIMVGSIV